MGAESEQHSLVGLCSARSGVCVSQCVAAAAPLERGIGGPAAAALATQLSRPWVWVALLRQPTTCPGGGGAWRARERSPPNRTQSPRPRRLRCRDCFAAAGYRPIATNS